MANKTALACVLLSLVAGTPKAPSPGAIKAANDFAHRGVMSRQEYIRLDGISTEIENGGKVSDSDLDFALALVKSNAPNPKETPFRHEEAVAYSTFDYKKWTSGQKDKLLQTALWLMHEPTPVGDVAVPQANKEATIFLLGAVNDKRAIPCLRSMESDPVPDIAKLATVVCDRVTKAVSLSSATKHAFPSSK
jgi:hypothetical protein